MSCSTCGRPTPVRSFDAETLKVEVFENRTAMGAAAAKDVAAEMKRLIAEKGRVNIVFASAPSQDDFTNALKEEEGIDWSRVVAFHLDEYVGLPSDHPQAFAVYIRRRLLDDVKPGTVYFMNGNAPDAQAECERYGSLLEENPLDIACIGIGENGHIAFNDPHVADFNDPVKAKLVDLDLTSRHQQVHDGCFPTLEDVPTTAITMTIPAIVAAKRIFCMVPAATKAEAVRATVHDPVSVQCPATIMRQHGGSTLYTDPDSAAKI